jgi:hypothetical protein
LGQGGWRRMRMLWVLGVAAAAAAATPLATAAFYFDAEPAVAAQMVDSSAWLAPPTAVWVRSSRSAGAEVGGRRTANASLAARGGAVWVDEVIEGVANTMYDDSETGHEVRTVVTITADGRSVEVDASRVVDRARLEGEAVKWAVRRVEPAGTLGMLTRSEPDQGPEMGRWVGRGCGLGGAPWRQPAGQRVPAWRAGAQSTRVPYCRAPLPPPPPCPRLAPAAVSLPSLPPRSPIALL